MQPVPPDLSRPFLVEREAELAALTRLLDAARDGYGGAARVLGAAGVGKTATVRALVSDAASRDVRTWFTSAGQLESRIPFGVVRRLLDRPVFDLTETRRGALERGPARLALAQLWARDAVTGAGEVPAQGDMLHSLGWLLEELTEAGAALVVVDDAQWADEESLLFLGSLRERLAGLPVAVVVAARDEVADRSPALAALVADRDAVVLRLAPLSRSGVDDVLAATWSQVPADAAAAVLEVTGGNPFLVHALAGALVVGGAVDAARVRAAVPDSVVDLMLARLSALPPQEQALARAVAVLVAPSLPLAAALAGLDVPRAAAAADHLRRAGLFADEAALGYRHALLRSAVYVVIGPDTRDQLHRSAARLVDDGSVDGRAHASAQLLAASGDGDPWAVALLRAAAAAAMALGAPQSAVALLERVVAEPPEDGELAGVLLELGQAQLRTFDPRCLETLGRALALTTDPFGRARTALLLAAAAAFAGLHEEAAAVLDDALDGIAGRDRELELTLAAAWASVALLLPGRADEARDRLAALGDLDGRTTAERLVVIQQLFVAVSSNRRAPTIRALAGRVIGDWDSPDQHPETGDWVWPRLFLGRIGDYDEVRRLTAAGLEHAEGSGSVVGMIAAHFVRALTELDAGSLLDAEQSYRAMLEHHDGGLLIQMLGHSGLAQTLSRQGRHREASEVLERFPEELPPGTPASGAALVWEARAVVRHADGDDIGALAAAEHLGALLTGLGADSPTWVAWRPLAIEPLRALGRVEEARALAVEHLDLCERSEVPHLIGEALCLQGVTAADQSEGVVLLRRGVAILEESPSRWRAGRGALDLGSLLRRSGNKVEAREHLGTASKVLAGCGAVADAEFADSELAATGVRLVRTDPRRLTPSERRVALLAASGLSNREIAARLHVTRKTVETHLSAVYRKLDLTSREELRAEQL